MRELLIAVVCLAPAVVRTIADAAEPHREVSPATIDDIDPAGARCVLMLCGPECATQTIVDFIDTRVLRDRVTIYQIGFGNPVASRTHLGPARDFRTVHLCESFSSTGWPAPSRLRSNVIWLHGAATSSVSSHDRQELATWLDKHCDSETLLIASGTAAPLMCAWWVDPDAPETRPELNRGCARLPGVVWLPQTNRLDESDGVSLPGPGRVHLRMKSVGAVIVNHRRLIAPEPIGSGGDLFLPTAGGKGVDRISVKTDRWYDLVRLERTAFFRHLDPFPQHDLPPPHVKHGALMLVGGGRIPDDVIDRFVELCGGSAARIVVVPTAAEMLDLSDHRDAERFRSAGAGEVTVLHTRDRTLAKSAEFLEPITKATGVWFTGGRQWRLLDAYEQTPFVEHCHDLLRRGGAIGGTSAGATIQGEYLVRGHPLGNTVTMAEGYERGFTFLPGTAVDQHFTERERESDLEEVKRTHPQLVCLGIDESTALVVQGSVGEVLGEGTVSVYDAKPKSDDPEAVVARMLLQPMQRYDFAHRSPLKRSSDADASDPVASERPGR